MVEKREKGNMKIEKERKSERPYRRKARLQDCRINIVFNEISLNCKLLDDSIYMLIR
jgi:hypothetical protein